MSDYLFVCRSMTHAQRIKILLERNKIFVRMIRTPKDLSPNGCSYAVRIKEHQLQKAADFLKQYHLFPEKIYQYHSSGGFQEAQL